MDKKKLWLVVGLLVFGGWNAATPYIAAKATPNAVEARDASALTSHVDFRRFAKALRKQ